MKKKILFTLLTILLSPSLWAQEASHWSFDVHAFKYDMTANVVLQLLDNTLTDYANYEVAAFCNDQCRGIADFQKVGDTDKQVGYLRIYSDDQSGDKITFKAYDKKRQREMIIPDAEIAFAENTVQGMPSAPLKLAAYYEYTVTTVANGNGTVSDGAVVRSGSSINLTATPAVGHHFVSWTIGDNIVSEAASFTYTPEDDATLKANFEVNQYTVRFVADGVDVYNEKQDYGSAITVPEDPTKEGHTFTGWSPEVDATVPDKDVTYTAQFSVLQYTMTFVPGNGQENVVKIQDYGTELTAPANPSRTGYTFEGWSPTVPSTVPASDQTFTAQWKLDTYIITYELNGGAVSTENPTSYTIESEGFTLVNPTREGYTFLGWTGTDLTDPTITVAVTKGVTVGNRTYTAQWDVNKYKITFEWEGGSQTTQQEFGKPLEVPTPERAGYKLIGWDPELPATVPASDKTYTAKWETNTYKITYNLNGGAVSEANPETYTVESDDITLNNPTRDGYQFAGWTSEDFVGASSSVTIKNGSIGDRTYTATWSIESYEITYDLKGGKLDEGVTNPSIYSVETADIKLNNPSLEGHTFLGWIGTGLTEATENVTISKGSTGARSYTATWQINQYTVTFIDRREGFEDKIIKSETLDFGSVIEFPEDILTWEGHDFTAWRADKAPGEGGKVPAYDLTYYSAWGTLILDLSYELDGKPYGEVEKVAYGSTIEKKADPAPKDGYEFSGWEGFPESGTMPAYDVVVKGKYTPKEYSITYNLAEGTLASGETNPATYTIESEDITLKNPTRMGYTFAGWSGTGLSEATKDVTISKGSFGSREYTATWTVNKYTMTFVLDNGAENVVKEQDYASQLTAPEDLKKTGFTFKNWIPEVPATVPVGDQTFTAQWERNSYQLTFIVDGEKVSDATIAFEGDVTVPADPTKTGYEFKGWGAEIPEKMPAETLTFTAIFEPIVYTISYELGDGVLAEGETNPASYTIESEDITLKNPSLVGYTFKGWQSTDLTEPTTEVKITKGSTGNRIYTAVWEINQYSITFVLNNGEENLVFTQNYNTEVIAPADPTRTGYTFKGWDKEIPKIMPLDGATITALWTINQYTLTFDTDGGTEIAAITQDYNTAVTAPAEPTKTGYKFTGWDKEIPETMPADDMTFKAQWEILQFTITFDTDGGAEIAAMTQDYNTEVIAPEDPIKEGYTFAGWDKEIPKTIPAENVTIKAQWTINQYTITFDTDGGTEIAAITQDYNTAITAPAAPTKTGYAFLGWDKTIPGTMPAVDMTITAKWQILQFTLTFDTDGGTEIAAITLDYNTEVTAPVDPTKTGYTFKGWDKEVPATIPAENVTLKAQWEINQYTITFDTDGGSEIAPIKQDYASAITAPADPTKTGYKFNGWDQTIPETMPAADMTITAQWEILQFTITFDTDGGTEVAAITQDYNTEVNAPADPTKEGYTFKGWDKEVPATIPAENVILKAQWEINQYTITFDTDGGSEIAPIKQDYASAITAPADPTKTGYKFNGWDQTIPETMPAADMTITAQWEILQFTITFDTDGGTEVAAITLDYNTEVTAPAAPTKTGYTFKGWDKEVPATIPAENVTLKAQWEINQYVVKFVIGEEVISEQKLDFGAAITVPEAREKEGYTFNGWGEVAETVPAQDVTYEGSYIVNFYAIYYYDEDDEIFAVDSVAYGEPIKLRDYTPKNPDRFKFIEWIGEKFETMPAHDLEYKASLEDGIRAIFAGGTADVYTLNGTKVRSKATAKELQNLPAGIYIIRGKKVQLK